MKAGLGKGQGESRTRHLGRGHIAALDGLRGLAVLGVMATHLVAGDLSHLPVLLTVPLSMGVAGVDLFFVLSGFLITGILRDSLGDAAYFRRFYARRVLRIFPLYYGVLLFLILLSHPLQIRWNGVQWSLLLYLQNTHFLFPSLVTFHNHFFSVDHFWSLAVEEQFYLVWPLLIARVRSQRHVLALCAGGMVFSLFLRIYCLGIGYGFDWVNRNTLCRTDELLAGAALALLIRSQSGERVISMAKPVLIGALALESGQRIAGWWLQRHGSSSTWTDACLTSFHYTWTLLIAVSLIACCLRPASRLRSVFEWKYLRSFGKYSYGLYVLHLVLLPGITLLLLEPLRNWTGNRVLPRFLIGMIAFCLSCVAAYGSFHLYEKRFLRLKRFFDYDRAPVPVLQG